MDKDNQVLPGTNHGTYLYPEEVAAEERAEMARVLEVDGEAYLRWLAGEGFNRAVRLSA